MGVELENPVILLSEKKISLMRDLLPILEEIAKLGRSILIIAEDVAGEATGDEDEQIGMNIVERALEEPLRQIVANAGKEGAVIVERIRSEKNPNMGYNVLNGEV